MATTPDTRLTLALDERLVRRLLQLGQKKQGDEFLSYFDEIFEDADEASAFWAPWAAYSRPVDGKTLPEWLLEEDPDSVSAGEREWLESQKGAKLSIWEITASEPDVSLTLRDVKTGEERRVLEESAQPEDVGLCLLARVVEWRSVSLLCGAHPDVLSREDAEGVVADVDRIVQQTGADKAREDLLVSAFEDACAEAADEGEDDDDDEE